MFLACDMNIRELHLIKFANIPEEILALCSLPAALAQAA